MVFEFKVTSLGGSPVFLTSGFDIRLSKIFGATLIQGVWYYPAFLPAAHIVLSDIQRLELPVEFSEKAQALIATLKDQEHAYNCGILPGHFLFKTQPRMHQQHGLVHILYYWRAALFYACGLGKTKIVIDWHRALPGVWPLIMCPKVVVGVWAKETKVHGINQEFRYIDADTGAEKLRQIEDARRDVSKGGYRGVVMSYDTMRLQYEAVATLPYNAMVLDESHYIKSWDAGRTKVALELAKKASRRIVMSGTPSMGDPRDMWPQIRFLSTAYMPEEWWKFKQTYCVTAPHNKRIVVGFKNLNILNKRVNLVALRKTKEECLDLPEQLIEDRLVDIYGKPRRLYNDLTLTPEYESLVGGLSQQLSLGGNVLIDVPHAATLLNKLIQLTCGFVYARTEESLTVCDGCPEVQSCVAHSIHPYSRDCVKHPQAEKPVIEIFKENAKAEVLTELLEEILADPANKVIIWGQYTPELDIIKDAVIAAGYGCVRVDGRCSGDAPNLAEEFNTNKDCRVYIGQVSTGVGLTLNAANYMIYYSLPWKLGDYEQSKDRNHRIGQTRNTTIYRLIGKGTVDEGIALALRTKQTVAVAVTAAIVCGSCTHKQDCQDKGIVPFGDDCIYPRAVSRPITKAEALE